MMVSTLALPTATERKSPAFQCDSVNVDTALTRIAIIISPVCRSTFTFLVYKYFLVAGAGFAEAPTLDIAA
jgi:hypothetical protein